METVMCDGDQGMVSSVPSKATWTTLIAVQCCMCSLIHAVMRRHEGMMQQMAEVWLTQNASLC
jgi:hypothetical protein